MKKMLLSILLISYSIIVLGQNKVNIEKRFNVLETKIEAFNNKRMLDSAKIYLKELNTLIQEIPDSSYYYRTALLKGSNYTRSGNYQKAMEMLLTATHFFSIQKDMRHYYRGKYKLGVCYYYLNRREETLKLMQEVVENKKYVDEEMITGALANIGAISIELGMLKKENSLIENAIYNFKLAIKYNLKYQRYTKLSSNYSLLAECHNQLKRKIKALYFLDSAIYFARKDKNLGQEGFALIKKANIYVSKKRYDEALSIFNSVIKIYDNTNDIQALIYVLEEKKRLLDLVKQYKQASLVGDSLYSFSIRNYDKRFADGISEMEIKYKVAEKERKILEQRAKIAEKGLLIQKHQYQIYGIIGLTILLFLLALGFYNQQKLKNKELIKENKFKVALKEVEIKNKLQDQRIRISRDLHDNIGAQLSFIISSIDNLKFMSANISEQFQNKLESISNFTSSTIDQLRNTVWVMNKDTISIADLHGRTLAFIEKAKTGNTDVKFQVINGIKSDLVFSSIEGMHLFRVLQEAVNNSLKYAEATKITIDFSEGKTSFDLRIEDNGKGFVKEEVTLGNGLKNMEKRMEEINADFSIHAVLEQGTVVEVSLKNINT